MTVYNCSNAGCCLPALALTRQSWSASSPEQFQYKLITRGFPSSLSLCLHIRSYSGNISYVRYVPSEKLLMASFEGDSAKYFNVTLFSPSRIIRCTMIKPLKTIVHVESRNRFVNVRNTSATPASPACVAMRMCSTYFDLGAASC